MVVSPYRQARFIEQRVERGACPWCHAEIEYVVDRDVRCPCCDAHIAHQRARVLLARLAEARDLAFAAALEREADHRRIAFLLRAAVAVMLIVAASIYVVGTVLVLAR